MTLQELLEEANQHLFDADYMRQGNNWIERQLTIIEDLL